MLNDGRIEEYASPQTLLNKEDGYFKAMVDKSRNAASGELKEDL